MLIIDIDFIEILYRSVQDNDIVYAVMIIGQLLFYE